MKTELPDLNAALREWRALSDLLEKTKARELELRQALVTRLCPNPKEGANTVELPECTVKIEHRINRNIDEAALNAVMPELPEQFRVIGVLIKYNPALVKSGYNALDDNYRKIFEQALVITEGTPALKVTDKEKVFPEIMLKTIDTLPNFYDLSKPKLPQPPKRPLPPVKTPISDAYQKAKSHAQQKTMTCEEFDEHTGKKTLRGSLSVNRVQATKPNPSKHRTSKPKPTKKTKKK